MNQENSHEIKELMSENNSPQTENLAEEGISTLTVLPENKPEQESTYLVEKAIFILFVILGIAGLSLVHLATVRENDQHSELVNNQETLGPELDLTILKEIEETTQSTTPKQSSESIRTKESTQSTPSRR